MWSLSAPFQHPSQAQVSVLVGPTVASSRATLSERKAGQLKQGQTLLTTSSKTASNLLLLAPGAANMPCTVKAPSKRQGCRRQTASRGREKKNISISQVQKEGMGPKNHPQSPVRWTWAGIQHRSTSTLICSITALQGSGRCLWATTDASFCSFSLQGFWMNKGFPSAVTAWRFSQPFFPLPFLQVD